jgi:hypothetical protein
VPRYFKPRLLSILAFTVLFIYSGCSDDSKGTAPVNPGPGPGSNNTTLSDTGTWSAKGTQLTLRTGKTEGGCVYDSATSSIVYADTTYTLTERMAYSVTGDTVLAFTDFDTSRNKTSGQVLIVRSEKFTYRRLGTGTGLTGTWITQILPEITYPVGSVDIDTGNIWAYAVGFRDSLVLKADSSYGKKQVILYNSVPDELLKDDVKKMLEDMVNGLPGGTVTKNGNTITASVTALPNAFVVTQNGNYPNTSLTATYRGSSGTEYMNPNSDLKCQGQAAFGEVLGRFNQDLYANGKRLAKKPILPGGLTPCGK